jgi:hypothetical protein
VLCDLRLEKFIELQALSKEYGPVHMEVAPLEVFVATLPPGQNVVQHRLEGRPRGGQRRWAVHPFQNLLKKSQISRRKSDARNSNR